MTAPQKGQLSPKLQNLSRLLIMQLHMVLRTFRIHDPNNRTLLVATENLRDTINTLWASLDGSVRLQIVGGVAYLNDARIRLDNTLKGQVDHLQDQFGRRGLGGIGFTKPVDAEALKSFLHALTKPVESEDDIVKLKESLERFKDLALELLDPRVFVDADAPQEEVKVDRKTFALQAYAKCVVAVRETIVSLQKAAAEGDAAQGFKLNVTRIIQDLVDIGTDRVNFLLKLSAIKSADDYAYNHAANTAVLSIVLGRALGVSRLDLVDLGLAGLFANLGFALLPPQMLEHERPLTAEERQEAISAMLQQVRGIFSGSKVTDSMMRRVVVAYEHNLPYRDPRSAEIEDTHPFSRIVAVASAFDALTTRRPWRDGYTADEALRILGQEADSRFDPLVVRVLTNLVGVFPLGAPVALQSGEIAVVYHTPHDPALYDRPFVRVIRDARGEEVKKTVIRNLASEDGPGGRIDRLLRAQDVDGVDPAMSVL